jgi:hypothetical protein
VLAELPGKLRLDIMVAVDRSEDGLDRRHGVTQPAKRVRSAT